LLIRNVESGVNSEIVTLLNEVCAPILILSPALEVSLAGNIPHVPAV
jgi:hypothetical protein